MTREEVIRAIVERDLQNRMLSADVVQREAASLYSAACENFGTWDTALKYAAVSVRRVTVKSEYTRERTLQRVRRYCCDGYDLLAHRVARRDWRLHAAACQHFGSWRAAMQAAGMNLDHVRPASKSHQHDRQKIIEELRRMREAGSAVTWARLCLENHALAVAVKTVFHSWRRALAAAGLASEKHLATGGPKWNRERIIEAIKARKSQGKPLNYCATRREDGRLVGAARRYFGGWQLALTAAGVSPQLPSLDHAHAQND